MILSSYKLAITWEKYNSGSIAVKEILKPKQLGKRVYLNKKEKKNNFFPFRTIFLFKEPKIFGCFFLNWNILILNTLKAAGRNSNISLSSRKIWEMSFSFVACIVCWTNKILIYMKVWRCYVVPEIETHFYPNQKIMS